MNVQSQAGTASQGLQSQPECQRLPVYLAQPKCQRLPVYLALTLAELHVRVLTSFIKFDNALTNFNEALTKPYHGLIEIFTIN